MKRVKRDGGLKRREFLKMSLAAAGAATLGAGVSAPAIGQQTRTIRFGHMLPTDQIHHKAIAMFVKLGWLEITGRSRYRIVNREELEIRATV